MKPEKALPVGQAAAGLRPDLSPALRHIGAHHGAGLIRHLVLIGQPAEDPRDGVPLLARRVQVRPQHRIDRRLERSSFEARGGDILRCSGQANDFVGAA
jgi:hypothetical protein